MEFSVTSIDEGSGSWEALRELWEHCAEPSPFQAPGLLRYFCTVHGHGVRLFLARERGVLVAAAVLKQDGPGNLTFLSDLKTDVNRFLIHKGTGPDVVRSFFERLLATVHAEGLSLTLNNQLADHPDTVALLDAAADASMFRLSLPNSACPIVEGDTPAALFERVNGLRELRYRVNKLRNQRSAEFEILTDDTAMEEWLLEFCDAHVRRWADTPTPSHLADPRRRTFLLGCLRAWASDGILVRFAVRVDGRRVGFVVGLRAQGTLVHHSTTYDPEFHKYSPGKALIHVMAEWMAGNGYRILDFGDGREDYKYTVATGDRALSRLFISDRANLRFIMSTQVIRLVRTNPFAYNVYQRHIKRRLRA